MVPRISPVCFPSEIERIAHNWYQPEYEIDSNVGDHLQKNERRNPQSKDAIADGKLRVREMNGSKPNMHTQVMREDLRTFAKSSNDADLLALLKKWDELNPPEAAR